MINCRHSHYLLGKWIECKRATPKEFTQSKRVFHEEKETVKNVPQITNYVNNFFGDIKDSQIQEGSKDSSQIMEQ